MVRTVVAVVAVSAAAALLTGCGGRQDTPTADAGGEVTCEVKQDTRIGIATGNATGVYFALGNAYAEQISAATGGTVKATAAETGASVQNIQQVVGGTYQVGFSLADSAADAVQGKGSFTSPQPVRALARLYDNYTQVIVRADAGINSLADLRGKRVSTGSPKSGTEVIAQRVLQAAGLDPDSDVSAQRLDLTKTVDGLKDGSIDAMFWSGGLPTPGITDLFTTARDKVRFLDITGVLPKLKEINPVYETAAIPAATYGLAADVPTIVVPNLLVVRDDLDANLACVLTKTLLDRKPQLEQANPAAKGINADTASKTAPVQLHRGSEVALG
ncbi:TAXI family TRAP transporter solute-binding subunit [Nocardia rhizosphaerihabitans]|uniref:C4-dicarboxylate ABC transporter substrate-binding protein n=1 Tax=Nocardia rhizosphaerihabitans TaxID=1691570 RepID=A0ABQ2KYC0_9NOCA|nr:TAXI family TRAP transporter solute-binding subunit [Nocardia rhizosphaerihabitans]GGN96383.1 C4-dicarboxylate ABC transporter substrate-binding protein [Nocardia rhizosphaerihabitans]